MQMQHNWWDKYETRTLEELNNLLENNMLDNRFISYDELFESDDVMIQWEVININRRWALTKEWVPTEMVACIESEKQTSKDFDGNLYDKFESELQKLDDEDPDSIYDALLDKYNALLYEHCKEYEPNIGVFYHFDLDENKNIEVLCE